MASYTTGNHSAAPRFLHKPRCVSTGVVGNACRRVAQVDTQADALATFIENMRGLADGIRWVRRTNLHLTLRFLGDAVDPKRLAALGKNLSEMLPRRPLSSAILHFSWQDLRGNSQARNARASIQWLRISRARHWTRH